MRLGKPLATGIVEEQAEKETRERTRRPGGDEARDRSLRETTPGPDSSPRAGEDIPTSAGR